MCNNIETNVCVCVASYMIDVGFSLVYYSTEIDFESV